LGRGISVKNNQNATVTNNINIQCNYIWSNGMKKERRKEAVMTTPPFT
jgi:hypothetical protein